MRFKALYIFFLPLLVKAQVDTIRFNNGDVKTTHVTEVGVDNIKYYRSDLNNGPLYTVPKSDIRTITYANGHVDTFRVAAKQTIPVYTPNPNVIPRAKRLYENRGKFVQDGMSLSNAELQTLIEEYPDKPTRDRMMESYTEMRSFKIKQYAFGFGGGGLGLICLIGGSYGGGASQSSALIGTFLGVSCYTAGRIVSGIMKKNRLAKARQIANIYNGFE